MCAVADLKNNVINECNELQAPMIRKGLVFYIYTHLTSECLENTKSIIAAIIEY